MFKLARSRPLAAAFRAATKVVQSSEALTAMRASTKHSATGHTHPELSYKAETISFYPRIPLSKPPEDVWHWCAKRGGGPLSGRGRVNC